MPYEAYIEGNDHEVVCLADVNELMCEYEPDAVGVEWCKHYGYMGDLLCSNLLDGLNEIEVSALLYTYWGELQRAMPKGVYSGTGEMKQYRTDYVNYSPDDDTAEIHAKLAPMRVIFECPVSFSIYRKYRETSVIGA